MFLHLVLLSSSDKFYHNTDRYSVVVFSIGVLVTVTAFEPLDQPACHCKYIQLKISKCDNHSHEDKSSANSLKNRHINPLNPKREREKEHNFVRGSQATPARPSGRNNVKVKTLW
jgi:hypothetical protein